MLKKILLGLLILLIIAQFFQPKHNNGVALGANDITHTTTVPDSVMNLLKVACFDCHSDHTNYPWYSKITPVNWWLNHHINEGKRKLNFSIFNTYEAKKQKKKLDEIVETVKEHEMPLSSYLWIHKEARLTDDQRRMIAEWADGAGRQVTY